MDENEHDERGPVRGRLLDPAALLALTALSLLVYAMGGATALSTVSVTGAGLFTTWRFRERPPQHRER
ncbi:hypothetical protein [Streptomyces galilaeus]|uniref:hypothetical protein n=1 Tax=Streptomyces galilaeus TaxID=33899 RepID=UPI001677E849|nr:hypothetical protein [Streptomyces galilaeus]GGW88177.1 hypothetical protein GCM10010350_85120 [Streptomyces galilaeus]